MVNVKLELRCPTNAAVDTSADPDPLWTLDGLLSELNSLELQLGAHNSVSFPLKKSDFLSFSEVKETEGSNKPFVMRILEDEVEESGSEDEITILSLTTGSRFACDFFLSESEGSDDEMHKESFPSILMEKKSIEEGILFELENKHHDVVKEQLRSKLSALEFSQRNESEKSCFSMHLLEKQTEARREMDRRLDKQYQRRIAEVLDNHLSILQRNHEQRSQIEEKRIKDDAVFEEAKRKEKALIEERLRQEKARIEAEARFNAIKQADAQKAALEAERKAAEAAEKEAVTIRETTAVDAFKKEYAELIGKTDTKITENVKQGDSSDTKITENVKQGYSFSQGLGIKVIASEAALKAESNRLTTYNEVAGKISAYAQKDIERFGRQMYKYIKQIGGTLENVRSKAHALVQLINDPTVPRPVSIMIFAKKVVSLCENPSGSFDKSAFACGWVILLVASQVPNVMDLVVAEFNRACIYTVPKHLRALDAALQAPDYWKMLGYREEDGKMETTNEFMNRIESCMKLYAALIQVLHVIRPIQSRYSTEIAGFRNPHGLEYGWAWLAMFVNALPANRTTAVALEAFLKMAGYALVRRYKSQFMKVLNVICKRFLPALKLRGEAVHDVVMKLEQYLQDRVYLREPEGRLLQGSSVSKLFE